MTKSRESAPTQGKRARLTRRKFLGSGAIVGAALVVSPALARTSNNAAPAVKSFELEETTIAELQAGMQSGKWSARELVRKYLARIAEIDKRGPTVNAIIELNPDAEGIADALDRERKGGHTRGPLHGIPVLIKDNIDTADRMKTTAGSLALAASTPPRDSFAAERLRVRVHVEGWRRRSANLMEDRADGLHGGCRGRLRCRLRALQLAQRRCAARVH